MYKLIRDKLYPVAIVATIAVVIQVRTEKVSNNVLVLGQTR